MLTLSMVQILFILLEILETDKTLQNNFTTILPLADKDQFILFNCLLILKAFVYGVVVKNLSFVPWTLGKWNQPM